MKQMRPWYQNLEESAHQKRNDRPSLLMKSNTDAKLNSTKYPAAPYRNPTSDQVKGILGTQECLAVSNSH